MRWLIHLAIQRPIGTLLLYVGGVILGISAAFSIGLDLLPELSIPKLIVSTTYTGLPTAEIRRLVTIPLEDQLASVKGIKHISSVSRDGLSLINLEFHWGEDVVTAAVKTREAIDAAFPSLPSSADKPLVIPVDPGERPLVIVSVRALDGNLAFARKMAEREIKSGLQRVEGVASVLVSGGAVEEICLEVDQARATVSGLRIADIAQLVAEGNYDYPVGSVTEGGFEYLVKAVGSFPSPEALGTLRFSGEKSSVRLADLAEIGYSIRERESVFIVDGMEAVGLSIMKQKGFGPALVADGIGHEVASLGAAYGNDLAIELVYDGSRFISESIRNLVLSTLIGAGIAFVVLILFLRDIRTAGILMLSIPVASAFTLLSLQAFGRTINVMSLGGLALGIGMIVDNSVVILENLKRRHSDGRQVDEISTYTFTAELAGSNIGSTLTSIVVFLPILFVPGLVGALFTDLSLSVIFAQVSSFVISISLMPVLFLLAFRHSAPDKRIGEGRLIRNFGWLLSIAIRKPRRVFVAVMLATAAGAACLPALPFDFMPPQDNGELTVQILLPYGTGIERTGEIARDASLILLSIPGIDRTFARVGAEPDDIQFFSGPEERREAINLFATTKRLSRRPTSVIAEEARASLVLEDAAVEISLPGSIIQPLIGLKQGDTRLIALAESPEEARSRALDAISDLERRNSGLKCTMYPKETKTGIRIDPDREALALAHLTLSDLAGTLRDAISGSYPSRMVIEGRDIDIRIRAKMAGSPNASEIPDILIARPGGSALHVSDISAISPTEVQAMLFRKDRSDAVIIKVSGSAKLGNRELEGMLVKTPWLESVEASALSESLGAIATVFALVLVLLYLVLGAQFESFFLPALLLVAIPLCFSGIAIALVLGGKSLSFDALLGIVVLFGVAVNNSILLYESYNERRKQGATIIAAVYRGTVERFRPILITVLTTVLALFPIAIDPWKTSAQSSMAVAIIGGLVASTCLTLFVVPLIFIVYYRKVDGRRVV